MYIFDPRKVLNNAQSASEQPHEIRKIQRKSNIFIRISYHFWSQNPEGLPLWSLIWETSRYRKNFSSGSFDPHELFTQYRVRRGFCETSWWRRKRSKYSATYVVYYCEGILEYVLPPSEMDSIHFYKHGTVAFVIGKQHFCSRRTV